MESNEIRETLRAADRAEAAPWLDYPPTPAWYPLAVGLWAAGITLVLGYLMDGWRIAGIVSLIAVEIVFLSWYARYRGTLPSGAAPRGLRPAIARFCAAFVGVVALVLAGALLVAPWTGAAVAVAGVTGLVRWYERAYAVAAQRTRAHLA